MANGIANGNGYVRVEMHYNDVNVARAEFKGLNGLAKLAEDYGALGIPRTVGSGILNFKFDKDRRMDATDFYRDALDRFHFNSGDIVPHLS